MQNTPRKNFIFAKRGRNRALLAKITIGVSLLLIILGAIGLVLLQKPLREENQDLRQQAAVNNGQVHISFSPAANTTLPIGQPASIEFKVDTGAVQIDGLELIFNLVTNTIGNPPQLEKVTASGLVGLQENVQTVSDGYLIRSISLPAPFEPFSTNQATTFLKLNFTPTSAGSIILNFDEEDSLAMVHLADPVRDELKKISPITYSVGTPATAEPTANPTANPTTQPTANPTADPTAQPTINPTVEPTQSPNNNDNTSNNTQTTSGVGGGSIKQCNDSCSSNTECPNNQRCYNIGNNDYRCRLVTNVSSSSCVNEPDNGLSFSCNEYCSNTNECQTGLSCYFNRCRNPQNLASTSCAEPTQAEQAATLSSCNQSCTTHKDCAANLLCSQGVCRLATNPSSSTCSSASSSTVSSFYDQSSTTSTTNTNTGGSTGSTGSTTTATTTYPTATPSPTASSYYGFGSTGSTVTTPTPTTYPTATPTIFNLEDTTPIADSDTLPVNQDSRLGQVKAAITNFLDSYGISLPMALVGAGLGLFVIVLLIMLIRYFMGGGSNSGTISLTNPNKKSTLYEQQLAQKINTLQNQQTPPVSPLEPSHRPSTPPPTSFNPSSFGSSTMARPGIAPKSNMVSRLQNKGITTPQNKPPTP